MKKLLALILALIMVLSITPMAYARRITYAPEIEEYIDDYIRAYAYCNSIYESEEKYREVRAIFTEAGTGINEIYPSYENLINIDDGRLEELTASHEAIEKGIDEVESRIAEGKIVVVIDTYEYIKYNFLAFNSSFYVFNTLFNQIKF